jgi:serine/threonine protein kinase/tetratricopeptide (TPR) repeat protein
VSSQGDRLSAALTGRYRIECELGAGGMATVYLAADLKHDRKVAIKVLKPELAAVLGAERFLSEIRTTASLQHPHILPLFDSGSADHLLFYVMPVVEGESLRERIQRERQLSVEDTVEIASVVAGALDYAHRRGVIHRDIKPENILIQDDVPLVADFGIAVAVSTAGGDRLTETGLSLGTPAYMSPEQAAGERDLDGRSDVYSLACVMYEMLAGDPPFVASRPAAVIARHITDIAPPITTVRRNVSPIVADALARALAKQPADRPASAAAFAQALRAPESEAADSQVAIVVLPFANRSPDAENEFFSDGLTEEVIADLSQVSALRVISRNSAMALKGTTKDTPTIARELGVSHVVTGSVRRAGNALRVTTELVEARTDTSLWSEKFSGTTDDVFAIQEEIARKIVAALKMKLSEREERQVAARPIANPIAYDCYLRARQDMYGWNPDAAHRADRLVDEALGMVGEVPLLLATKAQVCWNFVNMNIVPADTMLPRATEYAQRALTIEPDHALAIFVRGLVFGNRGRLEEALPELYRAHELWPGDVNILVELCRYSNSSGLQRHKPFAERTLLLDPLHFLPPLVMCTYHWVKGELAQAVEYGRRTFARSSPQSMVPLLVSPQLAPAGLTEECVEMLMPLVTDMPSTPLGMMAVHQVAALRGDRTSVLAATTSAFEATLGNEFAFINAASSFAMVGLVDEAVRFARLAVKRGFINYPFLAEHNPFFGEPRKTDGFKRLLDEVRPRWEAVVEWERKRIA